MKKTKSGYITLYTIEGIDYDAIIVKYQQLCVEGDKKIDTSKQNLSVYGFVEPNYKETRKSRKPVDDTKTIRKIKYLVHTIAYRQITNPDENTDGVGIQAEILQGVIGKDYKVLLDALQELKYIKKFNNYIPGKLAKRYKVLGNIIITSIFDVKIEKYINNTKERLNKYTQKRFEEGYSADFRETYLRNLNKIKVKDIEGFNKFIDRKRKPGKVRYYNYIKECFNNKLEIFRIDDNNRIYHVLTLLKRELKQYLNILYSFDCKNSHPLLFNYFIFLSKNISIDLSFNISYILFHISYSDIYNNSSNHYVIKNIRNILNNNNTDNRIIAEFADDELLYLWKTTTGRFWDDIVEENKGVYQRSVIKKRMFAQVFYSKADKDAMFATQFKRDYPNVYNLILRWKEPLKYDDLSKCLTDYKKAVVLNGSTVMDKDQNTALPNLMMTLESNIYREILSRLYKRRISAVHIHDAIVIPETRAQVEISTIEKVMRDVYKQFGLHPTFSTDIY